MSRAFDRIRELFDITEDIGFSAESLTPWVEKYGAVPDLLADYYTTLGADQRLNQTQNALVVPDDAPEGDYRMSATIDSDHLVFYTENQAVVEWGVAPGDVGQTDPIVWETNDGVEWAATGSTVSEFLLAQAHLQRVLSYEHCSEEFWKISETAAAHIRRELPSKRCDADLFTGVEFYGQPGEVVMLLREDAGWSMFFGADREERVEELRRILEPGRR